MQGLSEALVEMKNLDAMCELNTRTLKEGINRHVPTKTIKPRQPSVPEWLNRKAKKIQIKMGKAHRKAKLTKNSFDHEDYRKLRRERKKELEAKLSTLTEYIVR